MNLQDVRKRMSDIDGDLIQLLEERMELGLRAKRFKKETVDESREEAVLSRVKHNDMALVEETFAGSLFRVVIEESKRLQDQNRRLVGFQGDHGAYSEIAARTLSPQAAHIPCSQFFDIFNGVEEGAFDWGVVPVENSLEGAVTEVNDLLSRTELKVVGEAVLPVHHCLLSSGDTSYREIREVYSHPQALGQCRGFIERNKLSPRPFYDTAAAARMLRRDKP